MVDGRDPALNHYLVGKAIVDCNLSIWQRVFIFTKTHEAIGGCVLEPAGSVITYFDHYSRKKTQ